MEEKELREYVNNNITIVDKNDSKYQNALETLKENASLENQKSAVNASLDEEKKRLRTFLGLADKVRFTLDVKDLEKFHKYIKMKLSKEDISKVSKILEEIQELFKAQDKSLSDQIDAILKEIDETNNFESIKKVDKMSNLIFDQELKLKYRSLYLIYKADSVKDKNISFSYDLLNQAVEYISNINDSGIRSKLRIKQSAVRRNVSEIKDQRVKPTDNPGDDITKKLDDINKLLEKAEKDLDYKALEEALELMKQIPDGKEKDKLIQKSKDIKDKIDSYNNQDVKDATKLVEIVEEMGKYPVQKGVNKKIIDAGNMVNKLKNEGIKESLRERLNNLIMKMTNTFVHEYQRLDDKFDNHKEVTEEEITNLRNLFDELPEKLEKLDFYKAGPKGYGTKMSTLIDVYNAQTQVLLKEKEVKENTANKSGKKGFLNKLYGLKDKFLEFGPHWLVKLKGKIVDKIEDKLNVAKDDEDKKKIEKYQDKYDKYVSFQQVRDTVNNVRLFSKQNVLEKLKTKVYSEGIENLDEKQTKKFNNAVKTIGNIELRGLTKFTKDKRAASNSDRVHNVIKQYLELLSIAHDKQKYKEHWYKKGQEIEMIEKVKVDAESFIDDAYEAGTISLAEYKAYNEAINFIYKYRISSNNDIYKIRYGENNELINIEDSIKYYENPVSYKEADKDGSEIDVDIPHILRR